MNRSIVLIVSLLAALMLVPAAGSGVSAPSAQSYVPSGKIVADLGYRPKPNGFRFENYGPARNNLTAETMQLLFGKAVCRSGSGAGCLLHPPARAWLEEANAAMAGGHCQGFSVASLIFFDGDAATPSDFGAKTTFNLRRASQLESLIAYGFVYQILDRVIARRVSGAPITIVNTLIRAFKTKNELYTLGIYKPDGDGGHAITPFAIERRPDGLFAILVYDNNWPGETRAVLVDPTTNSWQYDAAINPDNPSELYEGNAETKTLELDPTFPGLGVQPCPFCGAATNAYSSTGAAAARYDRISLTGDARNHPHLLITDQKGRRLGYVNGKLVREIPGGRVIRPKLDVAVWKARAEPEYRVPTGLKLRITIDGSGLAKPSTSSFALITRGRNIVVNNVRLAPRQKSALIVSSASSYSYRSDRRQSAPPRLRVGFQGTRTDRAFTIKPRRLKGGATLGLSLDLRTGRLKLDSANADDVVYDLEMEVLDDEGREEFEEEGLDVTDEENDVLDYEEWDDEGEEAPVDDVADEDAATEEEEEEEEEPRMAGASRLL